MTGWPCHLSPMHDPPGHLLSYNRHRTQSHVPPMAESRGPARRRQVLQVWKAVLQPKNWSFRDWGCNQTNFQRHHTQQTWGTVLQGGPSSGRKQRALTPPRPRAASTKLQTELENLENCTEGRFHSYLRRRPRASIWPGGWRLDVYITKFSGKDSAGVSLAGTAPSCTSCAGRTHPPFILSEVAALAGCRMRHPRRLLETCSPASWFCCSSATDRTGALGACIIYKQECSIRLGKKGQWGQGEGGLQNQKRAPHSFHPRMHSLSVACYFFLILICLLGCVGSWLQQVGLFVVAHGLSSWGTVGLIVAECRLGCPVACGILLIVPLLSPALQGRFLTTGTPGKSPGCVSLRAGREIKTGCWIYQSNQKF